MVLNQQGLYAVDLLQDNRAGIDLGLKHLKLLDGKCERRTRKNVI